MAHRNSELLTLQGNCKRDPVSYKGDFELQHSHFHALLELFSLKPDQKSPELTDLVLFLAHVSKCYPDTLQAFPKQLMDLLDKHAVILQPQLRTQVVQALILMRHKGVVPPQDLLPLCFRLFQCRDKQLRTLLYSFIIADIRTFNAGGRNDQLNRSIQNYLYKLIEDDSEAVVKRSLAVLTELWRRQVWRDARTVNVIAATTGHASDSIMLAALKFFLGEDSKEPEDEDAEKDDEGPAAPTKDDVYRAYHKGTPSTKKKKIRKLKRVIGTVEKSKRRGRAVPQDSFAAMQLLHDPQSFAERLFARCQQRSVRFETRLVMLQVISRVIGVHELILENFYPFIQRYLQPSQREVVTVLAATVQACHKLVPPDVVTPVLKQLVDQFVHDKARPEVMTVGLKTVREVCVRCPLVMTEELLSDLVLYKKERDKHVKNAAKALVGLFRELKPAMLEKKERGRGADLSLQLAEYGAADIKDRVDGADLLEEALRRGLDSDDDDDDDVDSGGSDDGDDVESDGHLEGSGGDDEAGEAAAEEAAGTDDDGEEAGLSGVEEGGTSEGEGSGEASDVSEEENDGDEETEDAPPPSKGKVPQAHSIKQLKKRLAAVAGAGAVAPRAEPLEYDRILTQEDFERIRKLKVKRMVEEAMAKHGLKSAGQRAKMKERLFEEMEEVLEEEEAQADAQQRRLDPASLLGKRRGKADKAERMASVLAGREDREAFGSSVSRKKQKTGGLSNRQQQKQKVVLLGAMKKQAANRKRQQKNKNNPKHQRGRASLGAWD